MPIVSGYDSLTENISSYVDSVLNLHMVSVPSYVKYTSDFITQVHNSTGIPQNAFLVTVGVTSLYINIPHDDGITACAHFMSEGGNSQEARSVVSKLINLELTKISFCLMMKIIFKYRVQQWVPKWLLVTHFHLWVSLIWIFLVPVIKRFLFGCGSLMTFS